MGWLAQSDESWNPCLTTPGLPDRIGKCGDNPEHRKIQNFLRFDYCPKAAIETLKKENTGACEEDRQKEAESHIG